MNNNTCIYLIRLKNEQCYIYFIFIYRFRLSMIYFIFIYCFHLGSKDWERRIWIIYLIRSRQYQLNHKTFDNNFTYILTLLHVMSRQMTIANIYASLISTHNNIIPFFFLVFFSEPSHHNSTNIYFICVFNEH